MSRLDELLKQYCPNGVEWKSLGEIGRFYGGLIGKSKNDFDDGNAKFITYMNVYTNISVKIDVVERVKIADGERQNTVQCGDVLFTGSSETKEECGISSVLTIHPSEHLYLNSFCFGYRWNDSALILPDFAKHLFRCTKMRKQINKTASGVTRFNVSKEKMLKIMIPVPPLPVQEEIVRILDKFTELEEELELRKLQYEWYREQSLVFSRDGNNDVLPYIHKLLNEHCPNGVEWKPVGAVCDICTDYTAAGSFADIAKNVVYQKVPSDALLVRTMDIKSGFIKKNMVYINEHAYDYLWRVHLDKPCIIMPNIGNCGEVYHVFPEDIPYTKAALAPNAILLNSSIVVLRYLYHVLQSRSFQRKLHQIVTPVGQTKFNKTDFKALLIPVPPLPVQEVIVSALDNFSAMVTDISSGLPAEIAARRKQYEYYRDKLLSFEPMN